MRVNDRIPRIKLTVTNDSSITRNKELISNGLPLPQHLRVRDTAKLALFSESGAYVPAQFQALSWWPDGSLKWVLISFVADVSANETRIFWLDLNSSGSTTDQFIASVAKSGDICVDTGKLGFSVSRSCRSLFDDLKLKTEAGWIRLDTYNGFIGSKVTVDSQQLDIGSAKEIIIDDNGSERAVICFTGYYESSSGQASNLMYIIRITVHRDSSAVRVLHTIRNLGSAIELKGLEFLIPLQANHIKVYHDNHLIEKYCAASNEGSFGVLHDSPDEYYHGNLAKQDAKTSGQFAGWATVETESGWALSAAVRHFWEKYPKSLELGQTGFSLGLLPTSSRTFDSFLPGNQVKHSYALRQGESRTHEFMLYFHTPNPDGGQLPSVMNQCHAPLLALAPWDWYAESGALGDLSCQNFKRYPEYEHAIELDFQALMKKRAEHRLYGDRNFGDDSYRRLGSWNNCEYDYPHVGMLMFLRGGGRKWYDLFALPAARHMIDIDFITAGSEQGMVYQHDNDFDPDVLGHSSAGSGKLGSHAWVQGLFEYYAFSGDYTARDAALIVADRWAELTWEQYQKVALGQVPAARMYSTERQWGWTNLALMGAYHVIPKEEYLKSAAALVDIALELQNQDGLFTGFFERNGFAGMLMGSPIIDSLVLYYQATGDERVREMIVRAGRAFSEYGWIDPPGAWAYHAAHRDYKASSDRNLAPAVAYAYYYSDTKEQDKVLWERAVKGFTRSWHETSSAGKGLTQGHRFAVRMLALMDKIERQD